MKFADGTGLPEDEIVFATGYQNVRTQASNIFGQELASKVEGYMGLRLGRKNKNSMEKDWSPWNLNLRRESCGLQILFLSK